MEPIRILQVLGRMNRGGAETMVMNLYRKIDRSKIQFDFVVHTTQECAYDAEIRALGGKIYAVPQYKGWNHMAYVASWKRLFNSHPEYRVIHSHMRSTGAIVLKVAKQYGLNTILHNHNTSNEHSLAGKVKDMLQNSLRTGSYLDCRFACGEEAGIWLYGQGNFKVIPNAIDTQRFVYDANTDLKIRKEFRLENCFIVGNVARFETQKNHSFLIDIFHEIQKRTPNAKLMLVGIGSLQIEIKEKVHRLGLQDHVIFTGMRSDVHELMMAMDVFLFPSLYEGLPVTLIEAQAAGIPVVMSDTVSQEVCITDLVETVSLEASTQIWADTVLSHKGDGEKKNMQEAIIDAGYDITASATWMQNEYMQMHSGFKGSCFEEDNKDDRS